MVASSIGTPKMDGVFTTASRGEGTAYTGALNYLEDSNQAGFKSIFGLSLVPLSLVKTTKAENAVE